MSTTITQFELSLAKMLGSGMSLHTIIRDNWVPATIGNIIGGAFFVGTLYAGEGGDRRGGRGGTLCAGEEGQEVGTGGSRAWRTKWLGWEEQEEAGAVGYSRGQ